MNVKHLSLLGEQELKDPATRGTVVASRGFLENSHVKKESPPLAVSRSFFLSTLGTVLTVMLIVAVVRIVFPGRLLKEVELLGERGPVDEAGLLKCGERLRLHLRLGEPSSVLVFLEDHVGDLSGVYPPPGDASVSESLSVRLPPGGDFFETADLADGPHRLWILAAREPLPRQTRELIEEIMNQVLRNPMQLEVREALSGKALGLEEEPDVRTRVFRISNNPADFTSR